MHIGIRRICASDKSSMHLPLISLAILIARGKFVEARISHRVSASITESGSSAKARACFSNEAELSIPLDQYEYLDGAVAYDAVDMVSATELDAVAKLKPDVDDSLDSKSASK